MAGEDRPPFEDTWTDGDDETFVEPPTSPSVTLIAAPLPEMSPEIWQAGIQALVSVSDGMPPESSSAEEWAWEAGLFRLESALCDGAADRTALLLAAFGAALRAQDVSGAEARLAEALAEAPAAPEALRAAARLAEGHGDFEAAHGLWARLAPAAESSDERSFYAALSAEWTLARLGTLPTGARAAVPVGPARSLAVAEAALVGGLPDDVAIALGEAGSALGGPLGAALLEEAARFSESAGDRRRAGVLRASAAGIDAGGVAGVFGRLRDALRVDEREAATRLADLAAELPGSSGLKGAITRTAAGFARYRGDATLAARLLAGLPPTTAAAARDRVDLAMQTGVALDESSLARLHVEFSGGPGASTLAWIEADALMRRGEVVSALAVVEEAIDKSPDAVPLGLLAEELAASSSRGLDPVARAEALELWLRADPARRAEAALALSVVRKAIAGEDGALGARAALQTAIEAAPGSSLFWTVAAADARAGRPADAAATLAYGAESWPASPLAPALRARAAAHLALVDQGRALAELDDQGVAAAFGATARSRLAARTGDKDVLIAALAAELAAVEVPAAEVPAAEGVTVDDPQRRALLSVRLAMLSDDVATRTARLDEALVAVPDHPLALAVRLGGGALPGGDAAALLWRAGQMAGASALGNLYKVAATIVADLGDEDDDALRFASELVDGSPGDRLAHLALIRAAFRLDPEGRSRAIAELPVVATSDPVVALVVAEALVDAGEGSRAAVVLRGLLAGRFATEARRSLARLGAEGGQGIPPGLLFAAPDEVAAAIRGEVAALADAAREGHWAGVIAALETSPPHEARAGRATLHAAALVAEGRELGMQSARLERAVVEGAKAGEPIPLLALARVVDADGASEVGARAFALAAARFVAAADGCSRAVVETERARLCEAIGDLEGATAGWRAALAADPFYLPAARALRREVARRRDVHAAVDATESEAARLLVPAHRVRALLLAAALAEEAPIGLTGQANGPGRALRLLRTALEIDPAHDGAFEQLRALLEGEGDAVGLAAALETRIAVAVNPFEVTSLRLARAEVLTEKLGDRVGARHELDAILHKQPEHPRALARLAEICWDDRAWSEAGEVYLRRAVVEREPRALREIFLRLGHIYGERVPDPKRAITAYERVRVLEPDNREALRALSNLYLAEGDTKLALPVTERAAAVELDDKRRVAMQVRLGELLIRAGDLRRAGMELQRAVDGDPRDLVAVTALAHLLERARDPVARRALLDHAVGLLRHDLERGKAEVSTFTSLASLLALRDRPHAAAAATQLLRALGEPDGGGPRAPVAGRSAEGLNRPDIDDRVFPPGLPPGVRQIMRLGGPLFRPTGAELAQQIATHGVTRADRVGRGTPPRPPFEQLAAALRSGDFELYVTTSGDPRSPVPLCAEPGVPAAIVIGAPIVALGAAALRFAATRTLRLVSAGLDVLLVVSPEEAGALLAGIIRQFVPEYRHPSLREALVDAETARAARVIPRKLRPQLMPFAVESAGPFEVEALHAAVRDGANAAGLLVAGDLPSALAVVLAASGPRAVAQQPLTLSSLAGSPEALALLRFAVSDDYDDLVQAMESG